MPVAYPEIETGGGEREMFQQQRGSERRGEDGGELVVVLIFLIEENQQKSQNFRRKQEIYSSKFSGFCVFMMKMYVEGGNWQKQCTGDAVSFIWFSQCYHLKSGMHLIKIQIKVTIKDEN